MVNLVQWISIKWWGGGFLWHSSGTSFIFMITLNDFSFRWGWFWFCWYYFLCGFTLADGSHSILEVVKFGEFYFPGGGEIWSSEVWWIVLDWWWNLKKLAIVFLTLSKILSLFCWKYLWQRLFVAKTINT